MSKIIEIPKSKFVKIKKDCYALHEKAMLAKICCQYHPKSDKLHYELVTIKITSMGILPDSLVCLESFNNKCKHDECILHIAKDP